LFHDTDGRFPHFILHLILFFNHTAEIRSYIEPYYLLISSSVCPGDLREIIQHGQGYSRYVTALLLERRQETFTYMIFQGVLIECEPAIKSIIVHLDSINHDFIIEDLDDHHLVVKENMVQILKQKLEDVSHSSLDIVFSLCLVTYDMQRLRETYRPEEPLADSD
jgi:Transcription factor TFIIH complex subunit Tfb5.